MDLNDGEKTAIEFRKAAEKLEEESGELIKLFKQLSTIAMKDSKELSTTTGKSISYPDKSFKNSFYRFLLIIFYFCHLKL